MKQSMVRSRLSVLIILGGLGLPGARTHGAQTPGSPALATSQDDGRAGIAKQVEGLRQAGKFDEAMPLAERILERERRSGDGMTAGVAEVLSRLAELHELQGDWGQARDRRKEALAIREHVDGKEHWRTASARRAVDFDEKVSALDENDRVEIQSALREEEEAALLGARNQYAEMKRVALEVLETYRTILGPETEEVARVWHLIGRTDRTYPRSMKEAAQRSLTIRRAILPAGHPDLAESLNLLGASQLALGDNRGAIISFEEALAITRKALPGDNESVASCLTYLGIAQCDLRNFGAAKASYEEALDIRGKAPAPNLLNIRKCLDNLANVHMALGDLEAAKSTLEKALIVGEKGLPPSLDIAWSLTKLGNAQQAMRRFDAAKTSHKEALDIRRRILPLGHNDIALTLINLGNAQFDGREHTAAKATYEEALAMQRVALPTGHPGIALSLNGLGNVECALRDFSAAKARYEEALAICRKALPPGHLDIAMTLNNLGNLRRHLHDFEGARTSYEEALTICRKALPSGHPNIALALNNLGLAQYDLGEYAAAMASHTEALAIRRKAPTTDPTGFALSLNNLARVRGALGDLEAAKSTFQEALAIRRKVLPSIHPDIAISLYDLGTAQYPLREYPAAKASYKEALVIFRIVLPAGHVQIATPLFRLGLVALRSGVDVKSTIPHLIEACDLTQANDFRLAVLQAEREQFAAGIGTNDCIGLLLDATITTRGAPGHAYDRVARAKGSVTAVQKWAHQARDVTEPETALLVNRLREVTRQIVDLSVGACPTNFSYSHSGYLSASFRTLSDERARLERQLTERSAIYQTIQRRSRVGAAEIRAALPDGAALIDMVDYLHVESNSKGKGHSDSSRERHLAVFIVRPKFERITVIPLGPSKPLADLIDLWRASVGAGKVPPAGVPDPGVELRRRLWEPLAQYLDGVKLVLVSPDGPLNGLPLAALPGSKEGTFLIQDYAFAVAPVPQLLPELLRGGTLENAEPASLAVGDIDFEALTDHGAGNPRANHFSPLPGTLAEATAVHDLFRTTFAGRPAELLTGRAATEQAFVSRAPNCSHLLIATHGFFLPDSDQKDSPGPGQPRALEALLFRRNLVRANPALRSGLVFAGANYQAPGQGSAFLTALEASELDLSRVDLAVLSACETGLGQVRAGEGVLGLQRAFQLAGARTTVTSLWKVPDAATQALMIRFHRNLWQDRMGAQRMGKLEALREAQLWLLKEGRKHPELNLRSGLVRPNLGLREVDAASPFYWAAFVLSGDWR